MGVFYLMSVGNPRQGQRKRLSVMDEDSYFAVITLIFICLISGLICIYFIMKFFETALWHAQILLFAIVIISGAISLSSFTIAMREVKSEYPSRTSPDGRSTGAA
jgi:drug/metabolite transporter (DMT)-like permease